MPRRRPINALSPYAPSKSCLRASMNSRPRCSALFPYTTLFRSRLSVWFQLAGRGGKPDKSNNLDGAPVARSERFELPRSEEHTSELQSRGHLVCRLLLEKNSVDVREEKSPNLEFDLALKES